MRGGCSSSSSSRSSGRKERGTLWVFRGPRCRPSYNLDLLNDIHALQRGTASKFAKRPGELRYLVAGSRTPGVFSLGGDLDLFAASTPK